MAFLQHFSDMGEPWIT